VFIGSFLLSFFLDITHGHYGLEWPKAFQKNYYSDHALYLRIEEVELFFKKKEDLE